MIAAVLLVLVILGPAGEIRRTAVEPMPTEAACAELMTAFLSHRELPAFRGDEPTEFRSAACLSIPAFGRDA